MPATAPEAATSRSPPVVRIRSRGKYSAVLGPPPNEPGPTGDVLRGALRGRVGDVEGSAFLGEQRRGHGEPRRGSGEPRSSRNDEDVEVRVGEGIQRAQRASFVQADDVSPLSPVVEEEANGVSYLAVDAPGGSLELGERRNEKRRLARAAGESADDGGDRGRRCHDRIAGPARPRHQTSVFATSPMRSKRAPSSRPRSTKRVQHRHPVAAADDLRVHRHRQDPAVDVRVHPVELALPDLQHVARRRAALAVRVEVELEVHPVVELEARAGAPRRVDSRPRTSGTPRATLSPMRGWNGR